MGFNTLTKEQQETLYISYKSDVDWDLEPGEEYVVVVVKQAPNIYTVVANGYGIFKEDKELKGALKNVLTKKELTDKNGTVLKLK